MLFRSIATIIAVGVACVLFPRNDADARGGGGFHGGMGAAFHMGNGRFGLSRGHPMTHGDVRRDLRRDLRRTRMQHAEQGHWGGRRTSNHFARAEFGHWHRSLGFGSSARRTPVADGQWHAGGEFR